MMETVCKAVISPSYRVRLGILAGMFIFWFLYCMYDGYIAYPRQREIARAYEKFRAEGKLDQWDDFAESRGWPDDNAGPPGKDHTDMNIYTQFIMGYGVLPLVLIFGVSFVRSSGRWIALGEHGLSASWGQQVRFDEIQRLDKTRWRSKGIATVHYQSEGKNRKFVLDNFKFSPQEISDMVRDVESRLAPEQIIMPSKSTTPTSAKSNPPAE